MRLGYACWPTFGDFAATTMRAGLSDRDSSLLMAQVANLSAQDCLGQEAGSVGLADSKGSGHILDEDFAPVVAK